MQEHEEKTGQASEPVLTTEDIARPAPDAHREAAVYPGEATGGTGSTDQQPDQQPDRLPDQERDPEGAQAPDSAPETPPGREPAREEEPLLGSAEADRYRRTWSEIQGRFVDDPQEAVRSADTLVAEVMQAFAGTLSEHRSRLEKQWDSGEEVATEDLRQALRAYRSLIDRLLDT
ncbi:hypothetical protein OOK31_16185 [Streptomyces sp. NBC_00249]|uniref:hypothetical protein n=1 Tax=Streptomyces sp. NBC_00249 TaxID=2975690 RepID=UPI00224FE896|nr:hypothetical protein [Streptomyces sp. NBC_00249]MCX5195423.1 hypothetical protein [Streptomyces sp. NBC_00249]